MKQRNRPPQGLAQARRMVREFFDGRPEIESCRADFLRAFDLLVRTFQEGGTLFLCGNGGSYADCLHISGELVKTFDRERPLPAAHYKALKKDPDGKNLADEIQAGFRAVPLGLSGPLVSAVWNDCREPNIHYAQELYVMARPGDALLAISTSGKARNVLHAMAVARVLGLETIGLTGADGGQVAQRADVALRLPGTKAYEVQEHHLPCYHLLCLAVEAAFFPLER
ncbi:SIS domain-containing protein [Candidatus Sumerlaeota bacterium]|nr:SIS domain-containing protein [Candidatus Sumerlaeota bacterium]